MFRFLHVDQIKQKGKEKKMYNEFVSEFGYFPPRYFYILISVYFPSPNCVILL